jgi:acetyl esterase
MTRLPILLLAVVLPGAAGLRPRIEYARAGGTPLTMDAFVPEGKGPAATVMVVGPGQKALCDSLTAHGVVWFAVTPRRYPAAMDDVAAAIRWVRAHAEAYRVDVSRVAVVGEGAGGHVAALLGARYARELGIAAVVTIDAVTDLDAADGSQVKLLLGTAPADADSRKAASPSAFVARFMPPYLFVTGAQERMIRQAKLMCDKMRAQRATCEVDSGAGAAYPQKAAEWLLRTM